MLLKGKGMRKARIHQEWNFWKDGQEERKQAVNLPHDAMLTEKRDPEMENGGATGFFPGGKYFYSRKFYGERKYENQSVMLEFEGVYMNSSVFLNEERVGGWIYGYTNFFVDLTGKIRIGEENELHVIADNSLTPNSRWYTGSGIYRPVNLWIGGETYVKPQGLLVKTLSINPAVILIRTDYEAPAGIAEEDITVDYRIYERETEVACATGKSAEVEISNAKLWSAETPFLYRVKAILKVQGILADETEERFGIRTLAWSTEKGFQVNGETVKLRGGCIHHDNGILGACTYDKAEYRKIRKLKEAGFNAIRSSHYPTGKNLLDVCDELGMYVMDETFDAWRRPKAKYDYSMYFDAESEKDVAAMAWKDYNHPSVIMYSIGNEIADIGESYAAEIAHNFRRILYEIDGTRPVTHGGNVPMCLIGAQMEKLEGERGVPFGSLEFNELITLSGGTSQFFDPDATNGYDLEKLTGKVYDELDIAGHNYAQYYYPEIHECRPDRIFLSTETFPSKMAENWKWVEAYDYVIGDFQWTAWDYLGEAGIGTPLYGVKKAGFAKPYPIMIASCGSFDLIGCPEAAAYYTSAVWGLPLNPYIGVRPVNHSGEDYTCGNWRATDAISCWTWEGCEGRQAEILIYSIGKQVDLYQEGVLIARKDLENCQARFETVYRAGQLEAVSYDENGKEIGRSTLKSNGSLAYLSIEPEETVVKADPDELVYVPVRVVDENGALRMTTDKKIAVTVEGAGMLVGLGSARPETEESFLEGAYTSWHGYVMAAVRCTGQSGTLKVTATSDSESVSAEIQVI